MANITRLLKVAKTIESLSDPRLFNMNNWGSETECGTVACIGGYACILGRGRVVSMDAYLFARDWLGLENHEARELFYAHEYYGVREKITATRAVWVIRYFVATGEIDWNVDLRKARRVFDAWRNELIVA